MPPDPPRTLAPAARAKKAFDFLFSPPPPPPPPNRTNAARSLVSGKFLLRFKETIELRQLKLQVILEQTLKLRS